MGAAPTAAIAPATAAIITRSATTEVSPTTTTEAAVIGQRRNTREGG